jgi:hypothetical protein
VRNLGALVLTVIPLLVLIAPADARKPRCRVVKGGAALEHTRRVLVYQREDQVNACLRPSGRRYTLGPTMASTTPSPSTPFAASR